MHAAALHLAPLLAAEKSRVPFFIAGGLLAAWALIVSLGLGLRRVDFPGNIGGETAVIVVSVALVLAATSTAVITSGSAKASATTSAPTTSAPATSAPATTSAPSSSSAPPAKTSLSLSAAQSTIAYNTKTLSAKAGAVTITFTNASPLEHNLTLAQGSNVLGATPTFAGGSHALTLNLKPGTYTFYCTVPGHRAAGMEGTLTVS
jgi:plastocyanin